MVRGTYVEYDGRPAVRFERRYPHPIERVWEAVSQPEQLAHWFPSGVAIDERVGGTIRFSGDPNSEPSTGMVLAYDPPRRLAFSWGNDELHLELAATDAASCTLTLINVLEARDAGARNAAGWSVCIAELTKLLAGEPADGPHSGAAEDWRSHYEAYLADGLPSGAAIPAEA
jgi:uncharacterized protein YndB with AHSA1/START domain